MNTSTDKRTRDNAVPFIATPYNDSSFGEKGSDFYKLIESGLSIAAIRCSTPDRGVLVEAHLNLLINVASPLEVLIGIGRFDSDGITAITSYTGEEIVQAHKSLTGSETPIASSGSTIFIDGLNILPLLPKRGDANFNADGFVVYFKFNRTRNNVTELTKKFEVVCSTQMGLL